MHLTPKWRQILLFFCLYNNWPSMPNFKVKILLNSTGVIEAKSLKHEASQAFQTWYIKHEVQMASKSSDVALLIFEIIPSFFIMFHRHAWMTWQMFRIFLATIEMDSLSLLLLLFNLVFHSHLTLCYPTCRQRGGKLLREGWWRIKNEELFTLWYWCIYGTKSLYKWYAFIRLRVMSDSIWLTRMMWLL